MIVISEVAPGQGWVELYNRGAESTGIRGWSLVSQPSGIEVTIDETNVVAPHGFVVIQAKSLHLAEPQATIMLRRPDGTVADMVPVGPARTNRGWARYPVHGGSWYANTPLTPGHFNLPPDIASATLGPETEEIAADETSIVREAGLSPNAASQPIERSKLMLGLTFLLATTGIGMLVRRRATP